MKVILLGSQEDDPDSDDEPDVLIIQSTPTLEADRLGLAFPSLNPIFSVGTASIGSFVSAGSTPQMSPCASPYSADRHSSAAGKSPVSAGRPFGSTGRPVSAGNPTGSAGRPVSAGNLTGSAGRPVFAGNPTSSTGRSVSAGRPSGSAARTPVPVARIEAILLFLAFSSFIRFKVYQMDVKGAFLYGEIAEEVYVTQPRGFEDPDHLKKVYKEKYVADILKKFDLDDSKLASTPFKPQKIKEKNVLDEPISVHLYRSMIGCLMYLTATRPDIMFAVCAAARHQVTPKTSNLVSVKRIFKYLTAYPKLGLWYPRDFSFDLEAFSDSDYAGAHRDRKSTTDGCQSLGKRLISWQCKKQTIVATSSCEAEYVAAASCCGQWFLFTFAGRVTFCWLFTIPAGDLVSAGHILFLLVMYCSCWYALTANPTINASMVRQFWGSASEVSLPDGVKGLVATIDG
nr:putative ribonuclease H-like domain-containing protein [Tanacetum cinerariifolium]